MKKRVRTFKRESDVFKESLYKSCFKRLTKSLTRNLI
jgi:hypothetical protein